MTRPRLDEYAGQRVTVMGLGRFGGGVGVARFMAERGADVRVTDTLPPEALQDPIARLADLEDGHPSGGSLRYRLGEHNVSDFTTADLVVVNPAVKPGNRFVRAAEAGGVPITSEIRLLVKHLPSRQRTIGITGSAGKSTTTAMTAHVLRKALGQSGETPVGGWTELSRRREGAKTPRRMLDGPGVWMGGNIGGSLLPVVEAIRDEDWVVLELSSFMLVGLREDRWSPHIAAVTNISPNHLDWHGSMGDYVAAKFAVFEHQEPKDFALYGESCFAPWLDAGLIPPGKRHWPGGASRSRRLRVTPLPEPVAFKLYVPGVHNQANAAFAAYAGEIALATRAGGEALSLGAITAGGTNPREIAEALSGFAGLPHRLQFVGEFGGVQCYNDSKSTTPEAAVLAIEAFAPGTVRVILGGYDKGSDLGGLAAFAAERCAGVYTIGTTGDAIADAVEAAWPQGRSGGVTRCGTLDVAVERALRDAVASQGSGVPGDSEVSGDQSGGASMANSGGAFGGISGGVSGGTSGGVVVLSPGCASWDQFANYEERGERFVQLLEKARG
ncbi:MAG: UDP-N-acetylmuramoyl-L-alanine--D-glutamate ligase [Planctomycetota bacterium]